LGDSQSSDAGSKYDYSFWFFDCHS
jgi:hypothetical protein